MNDVPPDHDACPETRLAALLKALAHPARLRILKVLAERGTCVCGALVEVMPLAQATVSQHLKVLKEAGLIRGRIDGPRSCYCIDPEAVDALRASLEAYLSALRAGTAAGPRPLQKEETA